MQNKTISIGLIKDCLNGERAAQKELYIRSLPQLEMIGKRYLRESHYLSDALQETYIAIFRNLASFDVNKASFKTLAGRIMINNCLKYNERVSKSTVELNTQLHDQKVEAEAIDKMDDEALLKWLQQMPFQYYEVFSLHLIDGFSHDEIAKMIDVSPALSRKRLSRARAWIQARTGAAGIKGATDYFTSISLF